MSLTKASSTINEIILLKCSFNPINFSQMVSGSSFFKVVSHIYLNLLVGKFISTDLTTSSIFALPFIVKLKRMRASGLIEAFKIIRTDSLQLSYTYLAADIFKPSNFVGKCRWIMSPLMGIFNHFL